MREVHHTMARPQDWYQQLHKGLPSRIADNHLIISKEIGEGFLRYLEVQEGLWAQNVNIRLNEEVKLVRSSLKKNDYFILDFYLFDSEITREIGGESYTLGFENINLVLSSSTTSATLHIPAHSLIKIFTITFTREWLFKNVLVDHQNARTFFDTDDPIYLSEDLDQKLKYLLKQISFDDNRLTTYSYVIQIIDYLFNRVKERELISDNAARIHQDDLDRLLEVRAFIDENVTAEISLDMLADKAGMSLSKFKKVFKQVFGTTPYQYHLSNKMEKSMEALQQKKYNVSEIGFLMGYSNLSQFTKAFKNHFGLLPSQVT